jgi:hypothetical protein
VHEKIASQLVGRIGSLFRGMETGSTKLSDLISAGVKTIEELSKKSEEDAAQRVKSIKHSYILSSLLGLLALLSIIVAFWLMIRFAAKNAGQL